MKVRLQDLLISMILTCLMLTVHVGLNQRSVAHPHQLVMHTQLSWQVQELLFSAVKELRQFLEIFTLSIQSR